MLANRVWASLIGLSLFAACGGGGGDGTIEGAFRLVEFLESGQGNIPRNRTLTFVFSGAVAPNQDLAQRIQIENVQGAPNSNFSRAIGDYVVAADRVVFRPRLPQREDRSDAGLREAGNYIVFLQAGGDALVSESGDSLVTPQEFSFDTGNFFEDPNPAQPPRALSLVVRDPLSDTTTALDRLDPRPDELADIDNASLIAAGRVIDPGAGGAPNFSTPWRFELTISEPLDPATIRTDNIELVEVFSNATTSDDASAPAAPRRTLRRFRRFPRPDRRGRRAGPRRGDRPDSHGHSRDAVDDARRRHALPPAFLRQHSRYRLPQVVRG